MLAFCPGLIMFPLKAFQPGEPVAPVHKTEKIQLIEKSTAIEGEHHYWFSPSERFRDRHFRIGIDRSLCRGRLLVNGTEFKGEDATDQFRFDRSNDIAVAECLERTPSPIEILAYPKVFISLVQTTIQADRTRIRLDVTVRNTLPNAASCLLKAKGSEAELFIGPQTSQTLSLIVRLKDREESSITLELHKFAEAIEGAYVHVETVGFLRHQR